MLRPLTGDFQVFNAFHSGAFPMRIQAAELRVENVQRHLRRIEMEVVRRRLLQHAQMHHRILVPCKSDEANLSGLFGRDGSFERAALTEDAVRIVESQNLVELEQIDVIGL